MTPDTKRQVFFTHFRRWGSGAALPGRVPALKRRVVLQDLREISGASVGSMAAEELEAIGSDPAVAGPIEEGKSVLEKLLRSEAFDCPQKPLFDPIKAQEAAAEIVKGMAVSGRHRRADGRTGRAGQSLTGRCRLCSAGYPNRMHSVQTYLRCALLLPALFGCTADPLAAATTEPLGGNVLIILSDDIGIDKTAIYGEHPTPPATPNIDALASRSVLFRNAYAQPSCSPTRASLLTGRHPTRHGVGRWIFMEGERFALPDAELTIPQMLRLAPYRWTSALYGKWHLAGADSERAPFRPLLAGFDQFVGTLGNPTGAIHLDTNPGGPLGYLNWEKDDNGSLSWSDEYLLTHSFDSALQAIPKLPEPWFVVVATNGAHDPLHNPPAELLAEALPDDATELQQFTAMVEVVDASIGKLLAGIPSVLLDRTTVIYTSDNGTANDVGELIQPPWDPTRSKETVFEGGVNVPLLISGPLVRQPGSESQALVSLVDILPTVAEIAGIKLETVVVQEGVSRGVPIRFDGHSLVPHLLDPDAPSATPHVFAEQFYRNGNPEQPEYRDRMLRTPDWKLIQNERWDEAGEWVTTEGFYRMVPGAWDEGEDLFEGELGEEEAAAYADLRLALTALESDLSYGHPSEN